MAHQHGVARVTTLYSRKEESGGPAQQELDRREGIDVSILRQDDETVVLMSGELDASGAWQQEYHDLDQDTLVVLLLVRTDGTELIRCRVPLRAINPMECFMTNPKKRTVEQNWALWRAEYRRRMAKGTGRPDPEEVSRAAFEV